MTEFSNEHVRTAAESISQLKEMRASYTASINEIDKLLGINAALDSDKLMALYARFKPTLIKAGLIGAGAGGLEIIPRIFGFFKGIVL
ncbi:MAG: hypothetical protein CL885_02335 [Dehalococcoidia bacterium]|nr:hypothetical protein [Dehalococcoidia bacterium]